MFTGDGVESCKFQTLRGITLNDAHRLSVYRVTLIFYLPAYYFSLPINDFRYLCHITYAQSSQADLEMLLFLDFMTKVFVSLKAG